MKKITLLKSMLLLCALVAGSGSVWADDTYVKVTTAAEINTNSTYIIVCEGQSKAMGTFVSGKYIPPVGVTISSSVITVASSAENKPQEMVLLTVKVSGVDKYVIKHANETKYVVGASSAADLKTSDSYNADAAKWTIDIESSEARISNNKQTNNGIIYRAGDYNYFKDFAKSNVNNTEYYYGVLYKKVVPVSIPSSGYASLVSSDKLDFSGTIANLNAPYKATAATSGSGVTLTSMSGVVAASTPMIIKGTGSKTTYIPITSAAATADATGNLLSGSATAAQDIDANEAYILMGGKFCLVTAASSVPAGKAYLLANKVDGGANELTFVIDEENSGTTGIEKTIVNKATDGQIYNLAGQRVAQPSKGLFIVNGKKVIVK